MMTSGTGVHYKNWVDCGAQILKNEGVTSFFKGNGANILRGTFFDFVADPWLMTNWCEKSVWSTTECLIDFVDQSEFLNQSRVLLSPNLPPRRKISTRVFTRI